MRLLEIATFVPFPVDDGGRAGIFNITRELVENGIEVTFAAPRATANDAEGFSRLVDVRLLDVDPSTTVRGAARHLLNPVPYNIAKYYSRRAEEQLDRIAKEKKFDVIHVDSLHVATYGIRLKKRWGMPIALREHNFESEIMRRFRDVSGNPLVRAYASAQYRRLLAYEGSAASRFDLVFPISPEDDRKLLALAPGVRTTVLPAGVDTEKIRFVRREHNDHTVLLLFNYLWLPNRDSFTYYVERILPEIGRLAPGVVTVVAGKGTESVPRDLRGIEIAGYLDDIAAAADLATVAVVPLRVGSGMRIKILELMAMGRVVITTSVGAEGIAAESGVHCIIADDPKEFAAQVVRYLRSPDEARALGERARQFVELRYSWKSIGRKFVESYVALTERARQAPQGSASAPSH